MLATLSSVTAGNRIKNHAREYGVYVQVIQTPNKLTKDGCGYSLKFNSKDRNIISSCARNLKIKIRAFFEENISNGITEYKRV